MKFTLIANEAQREGFKLQVESNNEKEAEIVRELTKLVIEKIKSIEVKVNTASY